MIRGLAHWVSLAQTDSCRAGVCLIPIAWHEGLQPSVFLYCGYKI